ERIDDARARLRREHVVVIRGGMAVEELDLFLFVLGGGTHVAAFGWKCVTGRATESVCSLPRLRGRGGERVTCPNLSVEPPPCPSPASGGGDAVALSVIVQPAAVAVLKASIRVDTGGLDRRAPFLDLARDEVRKVLRRAALGGHERHPELVHALRQRRRGH